MSILGTVLLILACIAIGFYLGVTWLLYGFMKMSGG